MEENNPTKVSSYDLNQINEQLNYIDGLGKPIQIVQKQLSPNQQDFIQPIKYDESGRQALEYKPYSSSGTDGSYKTDWDGEDGELLDFYTSFSQRIGHTLNPWSEKEFDGSPLNRVKKQGAPGYKWQLDQHPVEYSYRNNNANEVKLFAKLVTPGYWGSSGNYYDLNTLFVIETTDENGVTHREFKDKQGRIVQKETDLTGGEKARTVYLYDDFGNLELVISPALADALYAVGTDDFGLSMVDKWCYHYTYDKRQRMIEKKIPGKDTEYYVYDELDRIVLYQDANLLSDGQWLFTKYDMLGRVIQTGVTDCYNSDSRAQVQADVDTWTQLYEVPDPSETYGYTKDVKPTLITLGEVLTINWYDNYDFIPASLGGAFQSYNHAGFGETDEWEYNSGRVTGSAVKLLDGLNNYLYTVNYYDKFNRVIQSISQNHLHTDAYDRVTNDYDFTGNLTLTFHEHSNDGIKANLFKTWYRYTYDHGGRLIQTEHGTGDMSQNGVILSEMTYNELGELVEKNLHSTNGGSTYWQSVDYKYNPRGWLTQINSSNLDNDDAIIPTDQSMAGTEYVGGFTVYRVDYSLDNTRGRRPGEDVLAITITEYKTVEIEQPDGSTQTQQVVENNTIYLHQAYMTEVADFNTLIPWDRATFTIELSNMVLNESTTILDIMMQINNKVYQQLPQQGPNDPDELDLITEHIQIQMLNSMGMDYLNEDGDDLYGMNLYYQQGFSALGATTQYNGNIAGITWRTSDDTKKRGYGFQYDDLNRLTKANYRERSTSGWNFNTDMYSVSGAGTGGKITYDLNGNIESLKRYGMYNSAKTLIDDLDYDYSGNKLTRVDDASTKSVYIGDFIDNGTPSGDEYLYDDNGNMVEDKNKDFTVTYNYLNLPKTVDFGNGNLIMYLYDANGVKLRKSVYKFNDQNQTSELVSKTEYVGSYIYDRTTSLDLQQIMTDEGLVAPDGSGGFDYQYFLKDHLGNNRILFTKTGPSLTVLQENHYYPFGMKFAGSFTNNSNKYLYNGKELQDDGFDVGATGQVNRWLDWYDYGFRFYDPALARFTSIDPLAEMFNDNSPYHYALNNPIRYKDFMGMGAEEKGKEEEEKQKQAQQQQQQQKTETTTTNTDVNLTDVKVTNKDGEEATVKVTFKNTSDGKSSDNKVKKELKTAFDGAVKEAAKETDLTAIVITSTTNGKHSKTSRHASGKALDVGGVNGKSVKDTGDKDPVKALQKAFENQSGARENFGPSMMKKSGGEYINSSLSTEKKAAREKVKKQHQDHLHWSVD